MPNGRSSRTPLRSSIITRTALVFAVFIAAAALLSGWLVYRGGRDQLVREARADMQHTLDRAIERFGSFASTLDDDITFLSDNAPLREITAAMDSTDTALIAVAQERLALLMESFLRSRQQYTQVRLIGADSLGHEMIRFDRTGTGTVHVADSVLQDKGDRDYYVDAMRLSAGERYFSAIDLNKEHGRVEVPWVPTLRAAAPVFTPHGARAGIVVINADVRPLFRELSTITDHGSLMLANADGELLLHPDTALMFGFEFGASHTLDAALEGVTLGDTAIADAASGWIAMRRRFDPPGLGRAFEMAVMRDTGPLLAGMRRDRDRDLLIAAGVALVFVVLSTLFASGIATGLARLTSRVEQYAHGEAVSPLPLQRRDEVGRLARSLEHMQQRIDQRVGELEQARHAAEASDQARREFMANMSHEVRTPLNAVLGMVTEIDSTSLSAADRDRLALVQRSARRLKGLVDDLLLHEHVEGGRLVVRAELTDVHQLVMDILRSHAPMADAKGLAMRAHVAPGTHCRIDALRLHQVLDNLVGNAVKYTQRGQVDVDASIESGSLNVTVSDTGPGLNAEELRRVFDRFERAASSESDRSGLGLGLAITRRVVQALGGTIHAESTPGQGSRFTVMLPLAEGTGPDTVAVQRTPDPALTSGLRVLYVEDVASNRMVVEQWTRTWAWDAAFAATAEEAIAMCESRTFDLILLDVDLGEGMRGTQLGMRLRGLKRHRYAPMLAVTAYAGDEQQEEIIRAGLNDRITKPVDRGELLWKATWWCGRVSEDGDRVDLAELESQYDGDAEKLLTVLNQYRREFTAHHLALRVALRTHDDAAIAAVRHKLRPHLQLLGLHDAITRLDALVGTRLPEAIEQVFRACDRALMTRQRELLAITTGPAS